MDKNALSSPMQEVRTLLRAWYSNAQEKEALLRQMFEGKGTRAKAFVSRILPEKATDAQRFLAWGFVGFSLLTFWFVFKAHYNFTTDAQLALFYAILCAMGIAMENEYGGKRQ